MRIKNLLLSTLLIITIVLGLQGVCGTDAYAASEIPNVQYDGKELTWDPVEGATVYYIEIDGHTWYTSKTSANLKSICAEYCCQAGFYKFKLGTYVSNVYYEWENTYRYVTFYPRLTAPKTMQIKDDEFIWSPCAEADNVTCTYHVSVTYKDVRYKEPQTMQFNVLSTTLSTKYFRRAGVNDYSVSIYATADRYQKSGISQFSFKTECKLPEIEDVVFDGYTVSWKPFDGASGYFVSVEFENGDVAFREIKETECDIYGWFSQKPFQKLKIYVQAYENNYYNFVTAQTMIRYDHCKELYPLKFNGVYLDSTMNLDDLLGDGTLSYRISGNVLAFNDFDSSKTDLSKSGYNGPIFESPEGITIEGTADIKSTNTIFKAERYLLVSPSSDFKITSDSVAVVTGEFSTQGGIAEIRSLKSDALEASTIYIKKTRDYGWYDRPSYAKLKLTAAEGHYAIKNCGEVILDEAELVAPKGATFSESSKTVLNKDKTVASSVTWEQDGGYINHIEVTPVPTVCATDKPTSNPTSKPTSKPTATPSADKVSDKDPKAQILAFVERIYIYVLDREPEEDGAAFWSDELWSFRRTGAEVAQGFIFSPEFEARKTSDKEFVTILYKTFFGRDPEEEGMNFWLAQLASGTMDRVTVANGFIYSQEWADTCASYGIRSGGDLKPTGSIEPTELTYAFVERMYTTALGRGYDEEGKQYWASELSNFNITGEQCGASFFLSPEMEGYKLSDKDFLGRLYATFMNREADSDGEAYWLSQMSAGVPRADIVFGFTRSPEFTDKCVEARILPY